MRMFLTGGTGYLGAAILDAFVRAGHHVDALVRHNEGAANVTSRGARPTLGNLGEPASYAAVAAGADVVIHAAIDYSPRGPRLDETAIDAMLAAGNGRARLFIYTSGAWILGPSPAGADETSPLNPAEISAWRAPHE